MVETTAQEGNVSIKMEGVKLNNPSEMTDYHYISKDKINDIN